MVGVGWEILTEDVSLEKLLAEIAPDERPLHVWMSELIQKRGLDRRTVI